MKLAGCIRSTETDLFWPGFTGLFCLQRHSEKEKQMELGLLEDVLKKEACSPRESNKLIHTFFLQTSVRLLWEFLHHIPQTLN